MVKGRVERSMGIDLKKGGRGGEKGVGGRNGWWNGVGGQKRERGGWKLILG